MKTLLTNCWIVAMDAAMTEYRPGWLLVEGDRIVGLGGGVPPQAEGADIRDLGGDIVMPGMINTHCHMAMSVFRGLGEDVDDRLFRYILPLERKFVSASMVRTGSALSALEMIQGGVTTVADMYYFETEVADVIEVSGMRGIVGQTLADFAAAAHLSALDYISDVDWNRSANVKDWYAKIKSRPAFRNILADQVPGFPPPGHYADLDF